MGTKAATREHQVEDVVCHYVKQGKKEGGKKKNHSFTIKNKKRILFKKEKKQKNRKNKAL